MVASVASRAAAPVSYIDRIKPASSNNINALLAGGSRWWHTPGGDGKVPSSAARNSIDFSFMASASGSDSTGFAALDSTQQSYVRSALAYISTLINVTFNEVGAGSGDIKIGSNVQNDSAGYARYPNDPGGGEIFLANNQSTFTDTNWTPGSYAFETIIHEVGHALGLKHPGSYNAGGGRTPGPYLSRGLDNRINTIMSYYNPSAAKAVVYEDGEFRSVTVNPLGYGAYDIAALQYLYGAAAPGAGTTYSWETDQRFFQTIWDPSGESTIDVSNQTKSNTIDLRAGRKSSIAVRDPYSDMPYSRALYAKMTTSVNGRNVKLASVVGTPTYTGQSNLMIATGSVINRVSGGSGADTVITNENADTVAANEGDDRVFLTGITATMDGTSIDGGDGEDTLFVRKIAGAAWSYSGSTLTLTRAATRTQAAQQIAQVTVSGVESIKYWNGSSLSALRGSTLYSPTSAPPAGAALARVA